LKNGKIIWSGENTHLLAVGHERGERLWKGSSVAEGNERVATRESFGVFMDVEAGLKSSSKRVRSPKIEKGVEEIPKKEKRDAEG